MTTVHATTGHPKKRWMALRRRDCSRVGRGGRAQNINIPLPQGPLPRRACKSGSLALHGKLTGDWWPPGSQPPMFRLVGSHRESGAGPPATQRSRRRWKLAGPSGGPMAGGIFSGYTRRGRCWFSPDDFLGGILHLQFFPMPMQALPSPTPSVKVVDLV